MSIITQRVPESAHFLALTDYDCITCEHTSLKPNENKSRKEDVTHGIWEGQTDG